MKTKNKLLTLLVLSASAAAATAVINKCIKLSATSKNLLSDTKAHCYKWRFGNIHYTKTGSGKPLLLIHHLSEHGSGYEWNQMINNLKDQYTVYTVDLLGCGRSEKPDLTYTNYLYVQMISDFIKSEIGHRTNVIASGSSSSLAVMACNNAPELFDQIMLINPDSLLLCSQIPNKHSKVYKFILDLPIIGTLLYHIATSKQAIKEEFSTHYFSNPYSVKNSLIDIYYESAHLGESPKSLYASVTCNYARCNIVNSLKKIDNSIYIVGGEDMENIDDMIREYQRYNPAIETSLIGNSKFLPQLENPTELLRTIQMYFV
ncbi:alpha/beta fold hydrolase [Lacrimispora algidixylanolytica]|uniref:Alpha/beta hydrolase n=1 Tax=Lacrimispora algidixylanolytica TaxID=94868 RepID=A0A419TD26_9FIRM|nr:alpha/beta fold hydrolase [Lacrimispora algidixylanolytica]RKD35342.1 alpha/beta hydrolase [Lacrimispora algidixylanolytica]